MYCQTCGSVLSQSLTYCNRCGARVQGDLAKPVEQFPQPLIWAILGLFIGGIGAIIGLMAVMKEVVGFEPHLILAFAFACFFFLFLSLGVLLSMFIGALRRPKETAEPAQLPTRATKELEEVRQHMINEPLASVTEGTTRTFDPIYTERKSQ